MTSRGPCARAPRRKATTAAKRSPPDGFDASTLLTDALGNAFRTGITRAAAAAVPEGFGSVDANYVYLQTTLRF